MGLVLLSFTLLTFFTPKIAVAAEIMVIETPQASLGSRLSGAVVELPFKANFTEASHSIAAFGVAYNTTGWTYMGFEAYMDITDVTDQFDEQLGPDSVKIVATDIRPANGTLSVKLRFRATLVEGTYTFSWNYTLSAAPLPGPYPPDYEEGTGTTTVVVQKARIRIALYEGWNLIGLPFEPENATIEGLFAGNLSYVEAIYWYHNGTWYSWLGPGMTNTLTHMHAGRGYWVKVNSTFVQTVAGALILEEERPSLTAGWNLMSIVELNYTATEFSPKPLEDYLAGYNWKAVFGYDAEDGEWTYYVRDVGGELTQLRPGCGYWVYVKP